MIDKNSKDILSLVTELEEALKRAGGEVDKAVLLVRQTVLKRYPVLFALAVTIGIAATILGLEQILLTVPLFLEQPWVLFLLGVGILTVTGTLYKKLG